jgi:hypothetical protein
LVLNSANKIVYSRTGSITLVGCFIKGNFAISPIPGGDYYRFLWADANSVIALANKCFEEGQNSILSDRVEAKSGNSFGVADLRTRALEHINTIVCFAIIIPSDTFTPSVPFSNSAVYSRTSIAAPSIWFSKDSDAMASDLFIRSKGPIGSNEFADRSDIVHSVIVSESSLLRFSLWFAKSSLLNFSAELFVSESVSPSEDFSTSLFFWMSVLSHESLSLDSFFNAIETISFMPSLVLSMSSYFSGSSSPLISLIGWAATNGGSPMTAVLRWSAILEQMVALHEVSSTIDNATSQPLTPPFLVRWLFHLFSSLALFYSFCCGDDG